jgi:hypothetical protein
MNKEFFNLWDKKFRNYIINFIISELRSTLEGAKEALKIMQKSEVTESDLFRIYFILSKHDEIFIDELLFDYKMDDLSKDRKSKFFDIVEAETGIVIDRTMGGIATYKELLVEEGMTISKFIKLVDIFLDEA